MALTQGILLASGIETRTGTYGAPRARHSQLNRSHRACPPPFVRPRSWRRPLSLVFLLTLGFIIGAAWIDLYGGALADLMTAAIAPMAFSFIFFRART